MEVGEAIARTAGRLQRRASYQTRKGRWSTLTCCTSLSLNRGRFRETCSGRAAARKGTGVDCS
ncbi:hypothetical protein CO656_21105 [Sinorhizobium sp. FG01]|nr:hypothetical protein CO656_21105 [Sinorhizobium sp. FG01]